MSAGIQPTGIVAAPSARVGRHVRRVAPRVAVAVAVAIGLAAVLLVVAAPPVACAAAVAVAACVLSLGLCRVLAANDADAGERLWLRHVLGSLCPDETGDEDEDPGLLVY